MADLFIWFIFGERGEMFMIVSISLVTNSLKNRYIKCHPLFVDMCTSFTQAVLSEEERKMNEYLWKR